MLFGKLQAGCQMPFTQSGFDLYAVPQRPDFMEIASFQALLSLQKTSENSVRAFLIKAFLVQFLS